MNLSDESTYSDQVEQLNQSDSECVGEQTRYCRHRHDRHSHCVAWSTSINIVMRSCKYRHKSKVQEHMTCCSELDERTPWKTIKGHYMSVSVLAIPGRGEYCPLGMSKCGHLSDGCLDLVLVHETSKKNFQRYLRRHGNDKDQVGDVDRSISYHSTTPFPRDF